jgi:8-oxo-dGTP diphosphatase
MHDEGYGSEYIFNRIKQNSRMKKIIKVTAAILQKDGRIIIAQRKSSDHLSDRWEFPGGKIEPGETPEECLAREIKEEFDIDVAIGDYIGSSIYQYDHISIELMAYQSFWVNGAISMKDHKAYRWVTVDQLGEFDFTPADVPFVEMLRSGQVDISTKT